MTIKDSKTPVDSEYFNSYGVNKKGYILVNIELLYDESR